MSNRPLTKTEWLTSLEELWETAQQPRQWVGLTETDWEEIDNKKDTALDSFAQGAVWAADQLKERNT
jgi:hypothetical protein